MPDGFTHKGESAGAQNCTQILHGVIKYQNKVFLIKYNRTSWRFPDPDKNSYYVTCIGFIFFWQPLTTCEEYIMSQLIIMQVWCHLVNPTKN